MGIIRFFKSKAGAAKSSAKTLLNYGGYDGEFKTYKDLKKVLTNEDVKTTFRATKAGKLADYPSWVGRIVEACSDDTAKQDTFEVARFLVKNPIIRKIAEGAAIADHRHFNSARGRISNLLEEIVHNTPAEKRSELSQILSEDGIVRTIIGRSNPHYYVTPLSEGLLPQEFDSLLARTQLFADLVPNDFNKMEIKHTENANRIALNLLLEDKPELRNNERIKNRSYLSTFSIEDIEISDQEKRQYKERAWEYLEIAFNHCKGLPEQDLEG